MRLGPRVGVANRAVGRTEDPGQHGHADEDDARCVPDGREPAASSEQFCPDEHDHGGGGERVGHGRRGRCSDGAGDGAQHEPEQGAGIGSSLSQPADVPAGDEPEDGDQRGVVEELGGIAWIAVVQHTADTFDDDRGGEGEEHARDPPPGDGDDDDETGDYVAERRPGVRHPGPTTNCRRPRSRRSRPVRRASELLVACHRDGLLASRRSTATIETDLSSTAPSTAAASFAADTDCFRSRRACRRRLDPRISEKSQISVVWAHQSSDAALGRTTKRVSRVLSGERMPGRPRGSS